MNINLIPAQVQRRRHQRERLRLWAVILTAGVVILAIPVGLDWSRRADARQLRAKKATLDQARTQIQSEFSTVQHDVEETQAQIERADTFRSKRAWSAMVKLIAANVPADVWLTVVATDPARPTANARSRNPHAPASTTPDEENLTIDAPTKIKIEGYAPRASEPLTLVRNLQATHVFESVSLLRSSLQPLEDGPYFHFSLVGQW